MSEPADRWDVFGAAGREGINRAMASTLPLLLGVTVLAWLITRKGSR